MPCVLQETAAELEAESEQQAAEELEEAGGEGSQPLSAKDILSRAVAKMGAGIALCAVFSDPLVEALTNLSRCGRQQQQQQWLEQRKLQCSITRRQTAHRQHQRMLQRRFGSMMAHFVRHLSCCLKLTHALLCTSSCRAADAAFIRRQLPWHCESCCPSPLCFRGSRATGIAPFVVGFVLTPLASNSSEFVSSLTFAARKKRKNMSLTLSQVRRTGNVMTPAAPAAAATGGIGAERYTAAELA
jgi:Ca2+/Na+ antiporter